MRKYQRTFATSRNISIVLYAFIITNQVYRCESVSVRLFVVNNTLIPTFVNTIFNRANHWHIFDTYQVKMFRHGWVD